MNVSSGRRIGLIINRMIVGGTIRMIVLKSYFTQGTSNETINSAS